MNLKSIVSSFFCSKGIVVYNVFSSKIKDSFFQNKKEKCSQKDSSKDVKQQDESKGSSEKKSSHAEIHHLIILDESGSMNCVRTRTILGCNKTLDNIRKTAKKDSGIKQYVSIYCFDSVKPRYILRDVMASEVKNLIKEDYRPYGRTPLYDAIGYAVTKLSREVDQQYSVGVVTIITDGYENDSRNWTLQDVAQLIKDLKEQGWTFTFIGANIDVKKMASALGVDSFLQFSQSDDGMSKMFETDSRSRQAYYEKLKRVVASEQYAKMNMDERKKILSALNQKYFVDGERIAPATITHLNEDEIFVFGSSVRGNHDFGAALIAKNLYGAIDGQIEGIQGNSYAIPIIGNSLEGIRLAVSRFTDYAALHPEKKFMLTINECENAGFKVQDIAPMFRYAYLLGNVYIPKSFFSFIRIN